MGIRKHLIPWALAVVVAASAFVAYLIDADVRRQRDHQAQLHLGRGIELYHKKDYPHAELELRRALRTGPSDWTAPFYIGVVNIETKRYSLAVPYFERALILNPEEPRILNYLGVAYFNLGRIDMAKGYFMAALEVDPENGDAKGLMESMAMLQWAAEKDSSREK